MTVRREIAEPMSRDRRTESSGTGSDVCVAGCLVPLLLHLARRAFPQDAQKGRSARPQRAKRRGVPLRYVEPLRDARTPLAAFFSILLKHLDHQLQMHPRILQIGMGIVQVIQTLAPVHLEAAPSPDIPDRSGSHTR